MALHAAQKGKLISVIGDEVSKINVKFLLKSIVRISSSLMINSQIIMTSVTSNEPFLDSRTPVLASYWVGLEKSTRTDTPISWLLTKVSP